MKILIALTIIALVLGYNNPKNEIYMYSYAILINTTLFYAIYKWIMKKKLNKKSKNLESSSNKNSSEVALCDVENIERQATNSDLEVHYSGSNNMENMKAKENDIDVQQFDNNINAYKEEHKDDEKKRIEEMKKRELEERDVAYRCIIADITKQLVECSKNGKTSVIISDSYTYFSYLVETFIDYFARPKRKFNETSMFYKVLGYFMEKGFILFPYAGGERENGGYHHYVLIAKSPKCFLKFWAFSNTLFYCFYGLLIWIWQIKIMIIVFACILYLIN